MTDTCAEELETRARRIESQIAAAAARGDALRRTTAGLALGIGALVVSPSLAWQVSTLDTGEDSALEAVGQFSASGWDHLVWALDNLERGEAVRSSLVGFLILTLVICAWRAVARCDVRATTTAVVLGALTTVLLGGPYALAALAGGDRFVTVGSGWLLASCGAAVITAAGVVQRRFLRAHPVESRRPTPIGLVLATQGPEPLP